MARALSHSGVSLGSIFISTCGGRKPHPRMPAVAELVDDRRTRTRWTRVPVGCVSQNGTRDHPECGSETREPRFKGPRFSFWVPTRTGPMLAVRGSLDRRPPGCQPDGLKVGPNRMPQAS